MDRDVGLDAIRERKAPGDIVIIGGSATGLGTAVDAASRGYAVVLFEQADFGKGTSSRSTKLIHGGVRYLEKAIMSLDSDSWNLVKEAILERRHLINLSPHLSWAMPIIIPVYGLCVCACAPSPTDCVRAQTSGCCAAGSHS